MKIKWMKRFLLRLIRNPPSLLALLLTTVSIGPLIILGFFANGFPNIRSYWFDGLSSVVHVVFSPTGICLLVLLGCTCGVAKTSLDQTLTNIKQSWIHWTSLFSSFVQEIQYALVQEKLKVIGTHYAKIVRKEQDLLKQKEKLEKGLCDEQKKFWESYYNGRMKHFGYQNYLKFLIKNGEDLTKRIKDSVSEQYPAGDPVLLEEIALAKMILRKEVSRLDARLENGTWG